MIVVSGSAAENTAVQIRDAQENGFDTIALKTDDLVDESTAEGERNRAIEASLKVLSEGKNLLFYATLGPDDPIIEKTRDRAKQAGVEKSDTGKIIAKQQGLILRELLDKTGLGRICVAGGDTCSYSLRQLDIHSLELLMPIAPAAPLCLASSDTAAFDKLQVASNGGQIGAPDYFIQVLEGRR